jgi:hypothetical protein
MTTTHAGRALLLLLLSAGPLSADAWDTGTQSDNGSGTPNRLAHGSRQTHDLGFLPGPLRDQDWYQLLQAPYTSHEVVVEALSPELIPATGDTSALLELVDSAGLVLQESEGADFGIAARSTIRSLSIENGSQFPSQSFVRVESAFCTTTCTSQATYELRARETTYAIPRFNNSATQITILLIQNPLPRTVNGNLWFWSATGAPLATQAVSLPSKGTLVVNTSAIGGLAGLSGAVTLTHDAPYGSLSGKGVAVEPATGFTFDTPMVPRAD